MADEKMVSMTRVIEYYGPREWLEQTMQASTIPLNGVRKFGTRGAYIRGGIVMWQTETDGMPVDQPVPPEHIDEPEPPLQPQQPQQQVGQHRVQPLQPRSALRFPKPGGRT